MATNKDGTRLSGFVRGGENAPPRQCGNCVWMAAGRCNHPLVNEDPETEKDNMGKAIVDADDCCDNFQSRGNAVIYILRHGATVANTDDTFRGWRDVPLDPEGRKQAKASAKFLEDKNIKSIYTSDLSRAKETAEIVGRILDLPIEEDKRLRAWDVGAFAGKSRKTHQKAFDKYVAKPKEEIPMGESLSEFSERVEEAHEDYAKKKGPSLLVTSSSTCIQLEKQAEGKDPLGKPDIAIPPGGVMVILDEDGERKVEEIFGKIIESASYGS